MMIMKKYIKEVLILIISVLFLNSCFDTPKSPVAPVWDVEVYVPIAARTETVREMIKDSKYVYIDSSTTDLLIRYDTVKTETKVLDSIFEDNIKFEDDFVIKPQNVDTVSFETFVSDDSVNLDEAKISGGRLEYKLSNYLDKPISFNITIPGFTKTTPSGVDTLKFDISAGADSSSTKILELGGYDYKQLPSNPLGSPGPGFYVKGYANIGAGYSGDSVSLNMKLERFSFSYLKGKVKPYKTKIEQKTVENKVESEVKDILPKLNIYGAKLVLKTNSSLTNVEIGLRNFQVVGLFKSGASPKYLKIKGKSILDTNIVINPSNIQLNIDDFAINDFLSPVVPDSITYKGDIILNPNYKTIEISFPSSITYDASMSVFSTFKIDNASRSDSLPSKSEEIEINDDVKKNLDKALEGELTIELENGFPIGFSITAWLRDSLYNKLLYVTRQEGTLSPSDTVFLITAANVDAEGKVTSASLNVKKIKVTKDEIQKIKRAKKLYLTATAHTSNNNKVYLRANDKIQIRVYANAKVLVDFSDNK